MNEPKFGKHVVRQQDRNNWQRFAVDCGCHDNDHRLTIDLEIQNEHGDITLTFYKDLFIYDREQYPLEDYSDCKNPVEFLDVLYSRIVYHIKTLWSRFKRSVKILFTGNSRFEGDFYFYDLEHINEFIEALKYARDKMEEGQSKFDEKILQEYKNSLEPKTYMGEF